MNSNENTQNLTQRAVNMIGTDSEPRLLTEDEFQKLSTMEKWKALREKRYANPKTKERVKRIGRFVIAYFIVTAPITMNGYILPFCFSADSESTTLFLWRVIFSFVAAETIINWCLLLIYNPRVQSPIPAPPDLSGSACTPPSKASKTPHLWNFDIDPRTGLRWRWCQRCKTHLPPRGHHCAICERCVLQRDRHCFFTGNCVGYSNQRFFAPFAFYCTIVCLFILYFSPFYLSAQFAERSLLWALLLPPYSLGCVIAGRLPLVDFIVISHLYFVSWGWLLCFVFFLVQMACNWLGRTTHELHNSDSILSPRQGLLVHVPASERMWRVHGDYWGLNFLLPLHWIFPTPQDGIDQSHTSDKSQLTRLENVSVG